MENHLYCKNSEVLKKRNWLFDTSGITANNYCDCEVHLTLTQFKENCEKFKTFTARMSAIDAAKYLLEHSLYYDDCQSGEYMLDVVPIEDPEINPKCTEYFVKMLYDNKIIAVFFASSIDSWRKRAILDSIAFGL